MRGIWVTWENQIRNRGISSSLGLDLHEITCRKNRLQRYLFSFIRTLRVISENKPKIVAVQNPSIILALLALGLKKLLGYCLIVDAHNAGIFPLEGRSCLLMGISRLLQRGADLTLVTNDRLREIVSSNGGRAFVLPDRIPAARQCGRFPVDSGTSIAFICTFKEDEPYREVIEAAGEIAEDVHIYFTGNYGNKMEGVQLPGNVTLLGFLSEDDYWSLLASCDFIMDLTKREWCLVCGAYEGISLSKPLILSNTQATRAYFSSGCVYVDPDPESIAEGIALAVSNQAALSRDVKAFKIRVEKKWEVNLQELNKILTGTLNE